MQGWHWGLAGWGAAKVIQLKGVNPTGSIIVTKPKERCPQLAFLCTAMPVWYRSASGKETRGLFLHPVAWRTNVGFFQWDKRVGGAAWTLFPFCAVLLEDLNISYLVSDAWSAFLPAPTLLWRRPTAMESVTGRKCL